MEKDRFCGNCFFSFRQEDSKSCPRCGYDPDGDTGRYPLALPRGTVLNQRFITGRVLGQGGFGITYLVWDKRKGQRAAVKEYLPGTLAVRTDDVLVSAYTGWQGEGFSYGRACFLKEAQTLAEFSIHPNIVHIFHYFEENGTAYFAMDYVEGVRFQDHIKEQGGRLEWQEAARLLLPVMEALETVHEKGIIHRDVTPDNIFVTEQGHVKLLDFGAARYSLGDRSQSLDVVLKHGFAPKEQYTRHGRQGAYTDVYTLAATFYYAVTGKIPPDAVDRIGEDSLIYPSHMGIALPVGVENALLKALAVQPEERYQNMAEFRTALSGEMHTDRESTAAGAEKDGSQTILQEAVKERRTKKGYPGRGAGVYLKYLLICITIYFVWNRIFISHVSIFSKFSFQDIPVISKIAAVFGSNSDPAGDSHNSGQKNTSRKNTPEEQKKKDRSKSNSSFAQNPETEHKTEKGNGKAAAQAEGNTMGNIAEDGMAAEDGRYRFYTTVNGLLRIEKASGEQKIVDLSYADNLNIWDGWLYYIASGNICRMRPDAGSCETVVSDGRKYCSMYLAEGMAYLTYEKDPGSYNYTLLCADMKDWKEKEIISGLSYKGYTIAGGLIYYRDREDGFLYKKALDGSKKDRKILLSKTYFTSPVYAEGWIYGYTPQNSICAAAADGTGEMTVKKYNAFPVSGINIIDGTIYYYSGCRQEEKGRIASVRLDGTDARELYTTEKAGDYFHSLNLYQGELTAAYCTADRMVSTVNIHLKTGRKTVY